jgi:hypothetical protein
MSDHDFDDSFDLTSVPKAPGLLSDTSQLSAASSSSIASYAEAGRHADLSLSELSLDSPSKRPPKFSILPQRAPSVGDDTTAEEISEEDMELVDETMRGEPRPGGDAERELAQPPDPATREDALKRELDNIRKVNQTLESYHSVLQETLAGRKVRQTCSPS